MAVKVKAKIIGLDRVQREFAKYGKNGIKAIRAAIYAKANNIMLDSIRVTPKDSNNLRQTWYATKPGPRGEFSELGYGAEYAHNVHEMPNDVNWSEPGTGNKFLEEPFNKHKTNAKSEIARFARKQLESGTPMMQNSKIPTSPKKVPT